MKIAYRQAAPNRMSPPEVTAVMRFARTDEDHVCPVCQKVGRKFWTMLIPFCPMLEAMVTYRKGAELPALTLVCDNHPLAVPDQWNGPLCLDDDPDGAFDWSDGDEWDGEE